MTAPEPDPDKGMRGGMMDAQADYLLGAVVAAAQLLRLIPLDDLSDHLQRRRRWTLRRNAESTSSERSIAMAEAELAERAYAFMVEAELLMDSRRNAAIAVEAPEVPQVDTPPSRVPLDQDDVWMLDPGRRG